MATPPLATWASRGVACATDNKNVQKSDILSVGKELLAVGAPCAQTSHAAPADAIGPPAKVPPKIRDPQKASDLHTSLCPVQLQQGMVGGHIACSNEVEGREWRENVMCHLEKHNTQMEDHKLQIDWHHLRARFDKINSEFSTLASPHTTQSTSSEDYPEGVVSAQPSSEYLSLTLFTNSEPNFPMRLFTLDTHRQTYAPFDPDLQRTSGLEVYSMLMT